MTSLNVENADQIWEMFTERRARTNGLEDEYMAFMVVLLNYGDHLTIVECTNGEWSGIKADLRSAQPSGIPVCPNGHPCMESKHQMRLGLVEEEI